MAYRTSFTDDVSLGNLVEILEYIGRQMASAFGGLMLPHAHNLIGFAKGSYYMHTDEDLLGLVADIVSAHVSNNSVSTGDVPGLIRATYGAIAGLGEQPPSAPPEKPEPAVTARKSLANPNHILSMIDGKPYTMLKRHLAQNGLTPAEYRERYELPSDYPMTSKNYSERRRELAHSFGLGRKKAAAEAPASATAAEAARKPRAKKEDAVDNSED